MERKTKIGDFRVKRDERNDGTLLGSWVPLALPTCDCLGATSCGTEARREMHEHPSPLPQRSNRLGLFKQNPKCSSAMLLSQQIHFLQRRKREQQSYIQLQPNLSLAITSALARPDILPAMNIIRTMTQRILLLSSLFSASCTGKAFCKQHVGL